ncbi:MAG: sulfotransferase [Gammaproteobacteria bacterium]|nr:sulfotransferase [Gammaproteobacteria bacterium]
MTSGIDPQPGRPPTRLQQLLQTGFVALERGDRQQAIDVCRKALAERPDMARAHYLAALIAIDAGEHDTAVRALEQTVRLNKDYAAAWARLAQVYLMIGRFMMAEECLRNATRSVRGLAATEDLIATVFRQAGNLAASHEWHEKAVASDDTEIRFLVNLANSHTFHGRFDEAEALLRRCLELDSTNAQAHWLLSRLRPAADDTHIRAMSRLLGDELPDRALAYIQYAIGKQYEDLQEWDKAFDAWEAGAAARRRTVAFDEKADTELFAALSETYTRDWFDRQQSDCNDAGPIFIVGEPRSGTTLLDRMLDAHPVVQSAGELRHLGYAVRSVTGIFEPKQFTAELMRAASAANMSELGKAYVEITASLRSEAAQLVDKLPSNYLFLPLIAAALPNAKIVHIRRDPMDSCLAIFKQHFADAYLYSYDLAELARHYSRYRQLMQLWRDRFGDRFIEVGYEDLVGDTETTLRALLPQLDLSWNAACMKYFEKPGSTATASTTQIREAPHQRSVGQWKNFELQLQPVKKILEAASR